MIQKKLWRGDPATWLTANLSGATGVRFQFAQNLVAKVFKPERVSALQKIPLWVVLDHTDKISVATLTFVHQHYGLNGAAMELVPQHVEEELRQEVDHALIQLVMDKELNPKLAKIKNVPKMKTQLLHLPLIRLAYPVKILM